MNTSINARSPCSALMAQLNYTPSTVQNHRNNIQLISIEEFRNLDKEILNIEIFNCDNAMKNAEKNGNLILKAAIIASIAIVALIILVTIFIAPWATAVFIPLICIGYVTALRCRDTQIAERDEQFNRKETLEGCKQELEKVDSCFKRSLLVEDCNKKIELEKLLGAYTLYKTSQRVG